MPRPMPACLLVALALASCRDEKPPAREQHEGLTAASLTNDRAKASYMVGVDMARDIEPIKDDIDIELAQTAMRASLAGEKALMDDAQLDQVRKDFTAHLRDKREAQMRALATKNLATGKLFLDANAGKPGIVTTPSGLQYQVLRAGKGARPSRNGTVSVHYIGRSLDGREFDNTYTIQHPAMLPLTRVMPGLSEGLALMSAGSKYRFWIPAALAYGEAGRPGEIEPNATLVFDIELLEVAGESPVQ